MEQEHFVGLDVSQAETSVCVVDRAGKVDDYDGYLSLVVSRIDEQEDDPTFLISRKTDRIELARLQADRLQTIATFTTVEDATAQLIDPARRVTVPTTTTGFRGHCSFSP